MVWATGFEPTACGFQVRRSTKLSYVQTAVIAPDLEASRSRGSELDCSHGRYINGFPASIQGHTYPITVLIAPTERGVYGCAAAAAWKADTHGLTP